MDSDTRSTEQSVTIDKGIDITIELRRRRRAADAKAVIPDSSYAGLYDETLQFHKRHGAFDPTTMGTVPNVGLVRRRPRSTAPHD